MKIKTIAVIAMLIGGAGCGKGPEEQTVNKNSIAQLDKLRTELVQNNADMAYAIYSDSVLLAQELKGAIANFTAKPNEQTFAAAKTAWLAAREPYGQSEVYRFRGGPIDVLTEDGIFGNDGEGPEGRINAWPLGEALIDYVAFSVDGEAGPESPANALKGNLIANVTAFPVIDNVTLKTYFEFGEDERNVTTGYHAIEFLLWGQDLNADNSVGLVRDNTPGQRPLSDFVVSEGVCTSGTVKSKAQICQRRADYLNVVAEILVDDLSRVADAWHPQNGAHYKSFVAEPKASLAKILESMGRLSFGELAGERINISLSTDSQEDEHSCFSDNTHRDIYLNALGIQNNYLGVYTKTNGQLVSGTSIQDLLKAQGHDALAVELDSRLNKTMQAIQVIDDKAKAGQPFDVLIQQGIAQPDIRAIISGLVSQTDTIEQVIKALQLTAGELHQDTEQDISVD